RGQVVDQGDLLAEVVDAEAETVGDDGPDGSLEVDGIIGGRFSGQHRHPFLDMGAPPAGPVSGALVPRFASRTAGRRPHSDVTHAHHRVSSRRSSRIFSVRSTCTTTPSCTTAVTVP